MKNRYYFLLFSFITFTTFSQFSEIKPGTVLPQVTTAQRNAITNPNGILVFDSNTQSYWFRQSGAWVELPKGGSTANYWQLNGSAGNEIKNTNSGGFWSANPTTVSISSPPAPTAPASGDGTRLMWIPSMSAFRVGTVNNSNNGWNPDSIGVFSTAMGLNAKALGAFSTALGNETIAKGSSSLASGFQSLALGSYSTALGRETVALKISSTAIGRNSEALETFGTALGYYAIASGISSTAIGNNTKAQGLSSTAIGFESTASGIYSVGLGSNNIVDGDYSVAIGSTNSAAGLYSSCLGYYTVASGQYTAALGTNTVASNFASTAMGYMTNSSGRYSTAMGDSTKAIGDYSTAMGLNTLAGGNASTAMGDSTKADGNYSTAMGLHTTADGNASTSMGFNTTASGDYSFATGAQSTASGSYSTAMGSYVSTNNRTGAMIIGDSDPLNQGITYSGQNDQLVARFKNGYYLLTSGDSPRTGVWVGNGGNSWNSISDSTRKENFLEADLEKVLYAVKNMKIGTWNYKGQNPEKFRHWGVMAQEFHHYFGQDGYGVIGNDTSIATADFDGVSFAAIKALEERTRLLQNENEDLKATIRKNELTNTALNQRLIKLEAILNQENSFVAKKEDE